MTSPALQPDQDPALWDAHADLYEEVFEPLTNRFAAAALDRLGEPAGGVLLDVAAGAGGGALLAEARGWRVVAVDASPAMVARTARRAAGRAIEARTMDAGALGLASGSMDAALSVFGAILCPDPVRCLREIRRVLRPGAPVALVTWTEPGRYELAARLVAAAERVAGPLPPPAGGLPAQLRFAAEPDFRALFDAAGFRDAAITRCDERLHAPGARWLGERLAFAPGLEALLRRFGDARVEIVERFVLDLERDRGTGPVDLAAIAFVGTARS